MKKYVAGVQACLLELPPEQIPLLLAVGLVIGVFPIMGVPTLLCLAAALVFRLNAPALQLLNSISTPLQLAMVLPLARAGERLCGVADVTASPSWSNNIACLAVHAVAGWACLCIPAGVLFYAGLVLAMRIGRLVWSEPVKAQA